MGPWGALGGPGLSCVRKVRKCRKFKKIKKIGQFRKIRKILKIPKIPKISKKYTGTRAPENVHETVKYRLYGAQNLRDER